MKKFRFASVGSLMALSGMLSVPQGAVAQAEVTASRDESAGVDTVVVTARRRSESAQSVPLPVSAFGEAQFERLQIDDVVDLSGRSPNVQITRTGAGTGALQVFVRGIGQDALAFNVENPVGIYLDDVYLGRVQGAVLDILDFERVEILRGPQGTLYGRTSTVGALKYVTKAPDLTEAHVKGSVTLGDFRRADALVSASVPLIDSKLAVKLDVGTRRQEGYIEGVDASGIGTGEKGNEVNRSSARLALLWEPNDEWTIDLSLDYGSDRSGSSQATPIACPMSGACTDVFGSPYKANIGFAENGRNDSWGASARVQYDFGFATLKSISAYRSMNNLDAIDFFGLAAAPFFIPDVKEQNQYSQELQLLSAGDTRLSWVTGLFYYAENTRHEADFLGFYANDDEQDSNTYAAFAEATYEVVESWNVTLGGRYSRDRKEIDRAILLPSVADPYFEGRDSFSTSEFTYKLGTDYRFSDQFLAYVTYSTGYRPAGYVQTYPGPGQADAGAALARTSNETSSNVEVGLKSQWFDDRLTLNLTGFVTDYEDLQAASDTAPFPVLSKDVRIKGVELEFDARPIEALTLYGALGLLDAEITTGPEDGITPRYAPDVQFSGGTEYRVPLSNDLEMFIGANAVYTSSFRTSDDRAVNPDAITQEAYTLVGAQVGVEIGGGKYRVAVDGKNLTDETYFLSTVPGGSRFYGPPRMVAVTFTANF